MLNPARKHKKEQVYEIKTKDKRLKDKDLFYFSLMLSINSKQVANMIVYCLSEMGLKKQCVGSGHTEVRYLRFLRGCSSGSCNYGGSR